MIKSAALYYTKLRKKRERFFERIQSLLRQNIRRNT